MVTLTINDKSVEVPEDSTVLDAARKLGINIPTLCHQEGLKPYGGCRLCLVEVTAGPRTMLTASCTYPATEGLVVQTDTEDVREGRKLVMDLLLSRCPEVPALQEMARQIGLDSPSFPEGESDCILCGKCVRMCLEVQGVGAISMLHRGAKREVTTPFGEFSQVCRTCGACQFVCPTGHIKDIGKISGKVAKPKASEFNLGLESRGNIFRTYAQAVPSTPMIDQDNCIHMLTGDCGLCAQACPAQAIDYEQTAETATLQAGSVILAPGFKPYDPTVLVDYGYGHYPNVFTSLEFERVLLQGAPLLDMSSGAQTARSLKRSPGSSAWA